MSSDQGPGRSSPAEADLARQMRRAMELHKQQLFAEAQHAYREILSAAPDHAGALHLLGVLSAQYRNFEAAASFIGRASAIDPSNATIHYNLANVLRDLGRLEDALASYARAFALDPTYTSALNNRGATLYELKRFAEAVQDYDRALAVGTRDAGILSTETDRFRPLREAQGSFGPQPACEFVFGHAARERAYDGE